MRILPVIDLQNGLVVRGVAGNRGEYRPIVSPLVTDPQPRTVANAFRTQFGFRECYVADLDAIALRSANIAAWQQIAECGLSVWLDAGTGALERATSAWKSLSANERSSSHRLVVGLESLVSQEDLRRIVEALGTETVVFSLDLKAGQLLSTASEFTVRSPEWIAEGVADIGVRSLIVLDLADVGTGGGTRTLALCRHLHAKCPQLEIIAGGGVRHLADLDEMATAGCSAALVASALHDGRLTPADCRTAESWFADKTSVSEPA